ncbi:MAG TPA: 7,8-didemethyl-8-hydroxy-5-deazariboflavin synthase subunit CofG [Methanocorpusculum sp.]|nr:7,8-didemethyl-8-hydroxy-5-deazariboflavin synthase subunit CofG [Methanocorpusculum sp.]
MPPTTKIITYSRNVFLPLTHVCNNACSYCSFKEPINSNCVMPKSDVIKTLNDGHRVGCTEALFTFGERPDKVTGFKDYITKIGYPNILAYCIDMCRVALDIGLLPHTNAGILDYNELTDLRKVNASMGLMLETTAEVPAHKHSPGKKPELRIEMIENAGKLKIPFTTGLLIGIGETEQDRVDSLEIISDLHKRYGHIQEVIIQNFLPKPGTEMSDHSVASDKTIRDTILLAKQILQPDISIQIPPNLLNATDLLQIGVSDLGGISPITIDYINPKHPWPSLDELRSITSGFHLHERLCVYPKYCNSNWIDPNILPLVTKLSEKLELI